MREGIAHRPATPTDTGHPHAGLPRKQHGAVLATSLVMLLLLTIIGITAMSGTTEQERMAGNFRDRDIAFQSGETALRATEQWLEAHAGPPSPSVLVDITTPPGVTDREMEGVHARPEVAVSELQYIPDSLNIGQQGDDAGRTYYRIRAQASGGSDSARAVLASTYARRD